MCTFWHLLALHCCFANMQNEKNQQSANANVNVNFSNFANKTSSLLYFFLNATAAKMQNISPHTARLMHSGLQRQQVANNHDTYNI